MRLVPLQAWIDETFEEPCPSAQTIRNQIRVGEWPSDIARRVGGRYFIDTDKVDRSPSDGDWLIAATSADEPKAAVFIAAIHRFIAELRDMPPDERVPPDGVAYRLERILEGKG